jgi:hypothetical protein
MKTLKLMPQIPRRASRDAPVALPEVGTSRLPTGQAGRDVLAVPQGGSAIPNSPNDGRTDIADALDREIHRLTGLTPCPGCGA